MKRRTLLEGAGALALPASSGLLWPSVVRAAPKVRVGLALPFTGVQAEVAADLRLGYELAFAHAEQSGLEIDPVWEDDKASADETVRLIDKFSKDRSIIAASGIVGTPMPRPHCRWPSKVACRWWACALGPPSYATAHPWCFICEPLFRMS
ncbi:ABC transporter substrate-binding protein [Ideonella paludis]|uniref:ABC transporter substrate-binding protein n=1 Tax=Ideonella paludis TaxID=1233411 RepID=UPI003625D22F